MALTPTQQTALDAFIATLAVRTPAAAPVPGPGPGIVGAPVSTADYWNPTLAATAAFAAAQGIAEVQLVPWVQDPRGNTLKATDNSKLVSFPDLKALAPDDVDGAKAYAAQGYGPDGVQRLKTALAFLQARGMANRVASSGNPESILKGAGTLDKAVVAYQLMTHLVEFADFGNVHTGGGTTIPECMATLYKSSNRKPGDPGASGL